MKEAYVAPEVEIIRLEAEDIIAVSNWKPGEDETPLIPAF